MKFCYMLIVHEVLNNVNVKYDEKCNAKLMEIVTQNNETCNVK